MCSGATAFQAAPWQLVQPDVGMEIVALAKPNYSFEKRQRELAKKRKKEEKRLRKVPTDAERSGGTNTEAVEAPPPPNREVES